MANICDTCVAFFSPENDINAVKNGYEILNKSFEKHVEKERFGYLWIGDLFEDLEIEPTDYMRTSIYYVGEPHIGHKPSCSECDGSYFTVDASEAWAANVDAWDKIADKLGLKYVYCAVEPGCEIFVNTDIYGIAFDFDYYFENENGTWYPVNEEELVKIFNEEYSTDCSSYEDCEKEAGKIRHETNEWCTIARFDYA